MITIRNLSTVLFILSFPILGMSQLWNKSFDKEVNFIKMTEAGVAIVGTDDATYGIDETGKVLWSNEKLRKLDESRIEVLTGSEIVFIADKGMMSANRAINVLTGEEYAPRPKGMAGPNLLGATIIHNTNMLLVVRGNKTLEALDIATNKSLWEMGEEVPHNFSLGKMASLVATFKGMQPITYTSNTSGIMHLAPGHLAEIDLNTGKQKWAFDFKPYKFKKPGGKNSDISSSPSSGYATMKLDQSTQTLYFPFRNSLIAVDAKTGKPKWAPDAHKKLLLVRDIHIVPEGILVLNVNGLTLLDKKTGARLWEKTMKVKGAIDGLLVQDGDKFFMVSKKYVLEIDVANQSSRELTDKIKFQGGESFGEIEVTDDLITLNSSQNIAGVNKKTGQLAYQEYYKAPSAGIGNMLKNTILVAVAVAATQNSKNLGQQNANALGGYSYNQYTPALIDAGTHASSISRDYMYINTKFKDKGFGLARVSKKTGELLDEIIIGDRSPVYAKDEHAELIYFKSGKKEIACRSLIK